MPGAIRLWGLAACGGPQLWQRWATPPDDPRGPRRTMAIASALDAASDFAGRGGVRHTAMRRLRGGMEALVLALVILSPWSFGAVEPELEFVLFAGVAALLALWGARMLLEGRLRWAKCPVALGLAALYIVGIWPLTPWPRGLLGWLAPAT